MPFRSKAQAAYLKHNEPKVFAKFRAETPSGTKLPMRAAKKTQKAGAEDGRAPYRRPASRY